MAATAQRPNTATIDELSFNNDAVSLCMLVNRRHASVRVIDFRAGATLAKRNFVLTTARREGIEKVYVLVESCRSGGLIGARPTELSSTKLLSAAPDENTLVNANEFSHCIRSSIANPRVDTWQKFIEAVKYCLRVSGGSTQPKNA